MYSNYETVVIGAGMAGLNTACQLAEANQKVLLVTAGLGSLLLSSGCVDVLGYQPIDSTEPLTDPLANLDDFLAEHPDHPYKIAGKAALQGGVDSFLGLVNNGSLEYRGQLDKNWLLPSTAGAIRPTCLAPTSLAKGDVREGGDMLIVGFRELRDFYPALISQNLNAQDLNLNTEALILDAPAPATGKVNITPLELARVFENSDFRNRLVSLIRPRLKSYARVGFPAVLGLAKHNDVIADLEKQLGVPVFEISTMPPSVPGRRLFEALRQRLLGLGGRLIIGSKVHDGVIEEAQVKHIRIETSNRLQPISAKNYVLATGGIYGGGVQTDSDGGKGKVWEPIFGLPIEAESNRHLWFAKGLLSTEGQPVSRYGINVNQTLNPINGTDKSVAKNLYVVGSQIANSNWVIGRTGDGVALATATAAANHILNRA